MIFDEPKTDHQARHILVVDPDSVRRGMLAITLPEGEHRLDFAATEEQGLSLLKETNHEIVIVGKSEMSKNLCQHIRALAYSCMLILMDEAFTDDATGEVECNEAGADTYLPFPFDASLFEQRVADCFQSREAPRPPQESHPIGRVVDDMVVAVPRAPAVDAGATWEEFSKRIQQIHHGLNTLTYYQLLDVAHNAPGSEIKDAYFQSAMQYHPDRFMQLRNKRLKGQIYEVYKRLSEAFKVLINPVTRRYYDKQLEAVRDTPEPNLRFLNFGRRARRQTEALTREAHTKEGKRYLHYAKLAEAEGRFTSARDYMVQAIELEPDNEALKTQLEELDSNNHLDGNSRG